MSFLPGRFLGPGVRRQIDKRQEVIGDRNRLLGESTSAESFTFFSRKAPFIKMTSGIDVGTYNHAKRVVENASSAIAEAAVLDNGYLSATGKVPGYEFSNTIGYRPQAGITGMNLRTHNRFGSLRTATVQFKCNSVEQLNKYEQVYMRPGYTALLEWGNSVYLDSNLGTVRDVYTLLSDSFLNKTIVQDIIKPGEASDEDVANATKQVIYNAIESLRQQYSYNYDGMYGIVKNFSWTIRTDGGYDCTVDIVSVGSTIEALTINAGITDQEVIDYYNKVDVVASEEFETSNEDVAEAFEAYGWYETIKNAFIRFFTGDSTRALDTESYPEEIKNLLAPLQAILDEINTRDDAWVPWLADMWYSDYEVLLFDPNTPVVPEDVESKIYAFTTDNGFRFKIRDHYTQADSLSEFEDDYPFESTYLSKFDGQVIQIETETDILEFTLRLEKAEVLRAVDHIVYTGDRNGTRVTYYKYAWDAEYVYADAKIIPKDVETTELDPTEAAAAAAAEASGAEIIKHFSPQYNSRIHLYLYNLKAILQEKMDDEALYQELRISSRELSFDRRIKTGYSTLATRKRVNIDETQPQEPFHSYIQLGYLLDIFNAYIPVSGKSDSLFKFHTSQSLRHKFKTFGDIAPQHHASVDIGICLLPSSYNNSKVKRNDILNIFVEIDYVTKVLDEYLNTGELRLYDVVMQMLGDIARVTGGINGYDLHYFEDTFTFHVVDREVVDPYANIADDLPVLELIGKNSVLRNLSITSKLSPAISTQIAVAAQASPGSSTIEGTMFERFNKGLVDRYIPEKKTFTDDELDQIAQQEKDRAKKLQKKLSVAYRYLRLVYGSSTFTGLKQKVPGAISEYTLMCKKLLELEMADKAYGGIIPFELSMDIEGMSGFQVMESFLINQNIIPDSYKGDGNIAFLITGLSHRVDTNGWVTSVKAQIYQINTGRKAPVYPTIPSKLDFSDTGNTPPPPPPDYDPTTSFNTKAANGDGSSVRPAHNMTELLESYTVYSSGGYSFEYRNFGTGNRRRGTLAPELLVLIFDAMDEFELTASCTSGGQIPASDGGVVGEDRLSATLNHDYGYAADVQFYKDGKQLQYDSTNPDDTATALVKYMHDYAVNQGWTPSFGAGTDYMGGTTVHVGIELTSSSSKRYWGSDWTASTSPDWLEDIFKGTA